MVDVAARDRVDAALEIGAMAESVPVVGDAFLVNTTDAQIGRTIQNLEIVQLPLVNRDAYNLLNLTPGVEMNTQSNTVGFTQYSVSINGSGDGGAGSVAYFLAIYLIANRQCWAAQQEAEQAIMQAIRREGRTIERAHPYNAERQHGFIDSQKYGNQVFRQIP